MENKEFKIVMSVSDKELTEKWGRLFHEEEIVWTEKAEDVDNFPQSLVLTDEPGMAEYCAENGISCAGVQQVQEDLYEDRVSSYFPQVSMVLAANEEPDTIALYQFWCRYHGHEVVITQTERLRIRESIPEDFDALYEMEHVPFGGMPGEKEEERERFLSYIKEAYPFYGYGFWTAELVRQDPAGAERRRVAGRCGLKIPEEITGEDLLTYEFRSPEQGACQHCLEMGYATAPDLRGQGIAVEMAKSVLEYAFGYLEADSVILRIDPENTASVRVAEKLGGILII